MCDSDRGVDAREDAATVVSMLFLIACSSITLDDSAIVRLGGDTGEPVPYPACYAACETLWVPAPECEDFFVSVMDWRSVSVEECQSECQFAVGDSDRNGVLWYDEWPANLMDQIPGYGCEAAARIVGETPCAKSNVCPDEG